VVVQKQTGGQVERDEAIDGVMLMCGQNEKYSEQVCNPTHRVEELIKTTKARLPLLQPNTTHATDHP
jgi:hypothetical protein